MMGLPIAGARSTGTIGMLLTPYLLVGHWLIHCLLQECGFLCSFLMSDPGTLLFAKRSRHSCQPTRLQNRQRFLAKLLSKHFPLFLSRPGNLKCPNLTYAFVRHFGEPSPTQQYGRIWVQISLSAITLFLQVPLSSILFQTLYLTLLSTQIRSSGTQLGISSKRRCSLAGAGESICARARGLLH